MKKYYALFLSGVLLNSLVAQVSFSDQSTVLENPNVHSGVAITVADANGDKLDDIIHLDDGDVLTIAYQQIDGTFQSTVYGSVSANNQWSMCAADVDENGYLDVMSGAGYDGVHLALANSDGTAYTMSNLPSSSMFLQGSCFGDFNNDGSIDFFGCHDDGPSRIWLNDGLGAFSPSTIINFDVSPTDDSGNYGVIWSDFDTDGDLDLYIAKCRQGVNDTTDARRINVLFENDGNNNFTETGEAHGLDVSWQSWTADFGDYDNDGDFDCFVTNHDHSNQLLENIGGGNFIDVTSGSGITSTSFPIQAVFMDFDNDGYLDVLVAGGSDEFFHNNGDGTFTHTAGQFNNDDMESFAVGDLNHDGFLDVYGGYAQIYTTPSNITDKVWLNDGNDNHFIAINFEGIESNINGIGAKVYLYNSAGVQLREVRAGVSYGIMNTFTQHFGLGSNTTVDSLVVEWPSGIVDVIENPIVDQFITIIEGTCVAPTASISADGPISFCSGEQVTLTATAGSSYLWSNNENTQSIVVTEAGTYSVTVFDGACSAVSPSIEVIVDPVEIPEVTVSGELTFCEGGSVTLTSSDANAYTWSNDEITQSIEVTESGEYYVIALGTCVETESESVLVEVLEAVEPTVTGDQIVGEGTVNLTAAGNNPQWYDLEVGGTLLATGNTYDPFITETTSFWVEDKTTYSGQEFYSGKVDNQGGGQENNANFNGGLIFDVYEEIEILSATVYAFGAGERTFQIEDDLGFVIASIAITIPNGESVIDLGFSVPPGTGYVFTCASDPSMYRNDGGISFPYPMESYGSIVSSVYGDDFYYYFYNILVKGPDQVCVSDRVEVEAISLPVGIEDIEVQSGLELYPNPTHLGVTLSFNSLNNESVSLEIYNILGEKVKDIERNVIVGNNRIQIETTGLNVGIYMLKMILNNEKITRKLIIR